MALRLYVNIDHVATLRQARRTDEPDPLAAAREALAHGADGVTLHLREDRRHVQDHDVTAIVGGGVDGPCNLELAANDDIMAIACSVRPYQATLVPERREEITTEGGLDLRRTGDGVARAVERLGQAGIRVSLFIDPDPDQIDAAAGLGVPAVELHTGRYSHHWHENGDALAQLRRAAEYAAGKGLAVHAGHGLTYRNVQPVAAIPEVEELNIGHSIVSRAIFTGIAAAVREMRRLMDEARA